MNSFKPLLGYSLLQSARLLTDGCVGFAEHLVAGLQPNLQRLTTHVENSLMLVTALVPVVGYDRAAEIVLRAHAGGLSLRDAAVGLGYVTAEQFDEAVDVSRMLGVGD
jgi:fumarate hydratase class II